MARRPPRKMNRAGARAAAIAPSHRRSAKQDRAQAQGRGLPPSPPSKRPAVNALIVLRRLALEPGRTPQRHPVNAKVCPRHQSTRFRPRDDSAASEILGEFVKKFSFHCAIPGGPGHRNCAYVSGVLVTDSRQVDNRPRRSTSMAARLWGTDKRPKATCYRVLQHRAEGSFYRLGLQDT